jgi:hypothetical protein
LWIITDETRTKREEVLHNPGVRSLSWRKRKPDVKGIVRSESCATQRAARHSGLTATMHTKDMVRRKDGNAVGRADSDLGVFMRFEVVNGRLGGRVACKDWREVARERVGLRFHVLHPLRLGSVVAVSPCCCRCSASGAAW